MQKHKCCIRSNCEQKGLLLSLENFDKSKRNKDGRTAVCKRCLNKTRRRNAADPARREKKRLYALEYNRAKAEHRRFHTIEVKYGLTKEQYYEIYNAQSGKCKICLMYFDALDVDHCHDCGIIRGLLCRKCNFGMGNFIDSLANMKRAVKYLEEAHAKTS